MSPVSTAMVLAAGLGTRMRPLTDDRPKPLVKLAGKALIDHVLDRLAAAAVMKAVVNVHYMADQIEDHLAGRQAPEVVISDERDALLDTGGGVARALPLLGEGPFFIHNSDSVWIEGPQPCLEQLAAAWMWDAMDALLLLARVSSTLGYDGRGDFGMDAGNALFRPAEAQVAPYVFTGVSIAHPRLFAGCPQGAFSLNLLWDRAIKEGRAFGLPHQGTWMHVGTPQAVGEAQDRIRLERA